ncbi:MFS transporter [Cryobacterium sp. MDB1-18-2]|uniref:MFS transporter n=1 Tax=Cryobacterium glucosi TaxID=1259175 RepID=A0ABY2IL88_9MICO|nr:MULTISPECIES: MFS transporter [Cryobacterium]MDY7528541.1 MFS transporter [Cryobacterium sp. 10C2]MEB0291761.1 MFS transporter [Cryobacterium sp. 10C2]TFB94873.1 MFS transporter [Cryobacterium sp. MDB2-A-1]TFC06600.1 MFS transporter [Cryobacterium sp. MDB2-33-2]TFC15764.1 MFS transporter [Cryobacterium sp. MDB2-A-2]
MNPTPIRGLWAGRTLALLGILLVAANLRTAVAALSPIVLAISVDVPLGALAIGVLGMLPPVCFAVFGIFTPVFTRRIGLERVVVVALVAILAGHLLRGSAGSLTWLIGGSIVTFAGLGAGNVLLPPLVKKYFPDRVGLVTSLYVTVLSLSTLVPPLIAVPVADAAGWRVSLGMWMIPALLALVPWATMLVRHRMSQSAPPAVPEAEPVLLARIGRSSIAWAIAVVFGTSSLNAYALFAWLPLMLTQTAGISPGQAGTLLSLYAAVGLPCALVVPWLAVRMKNLSLLIYVGMFAFIAGDVGLLLAPGTLTVLWVLLAGLGPLYFPLALVLINLRTRTHEGSVALSGFVQSVGYTLGALGPLVVGVLHQLTGGWSWPIWFLIATGLAVGFAARVIARPHLLEDDLDRSR